MKLSEGLIEEFIDLIKRGARITAACQYLCIHRDTYYDWNQRGLTLSGEIENKTRQRKNLTKNQKLYLKFHEDVGKAFVERELSLLSKIEGSEKWQAHAWILERQFREHYAPRRLLDTEAFLKRFEQENGTAMAELLQKVLDAAEALAASSQTFDEPEMQGKKLELAAAQDEDTQDAN